MTAKPKKPDSVEVRVLRDHDEWKCGDVATLSADAAAEATADGWADAHPDAVAAAKAA